MTSIFEAMGGYESAPVEEGAQPAKKRRVDEYTLRLTQQQWRILEALGDGAALGMYLSGSLCTLTWRDGHWDWHSRRTATSLERRSLIAAEGAVYLLTDEGRKALRIREQNKPGQI